MNNVSTAVYIYILRILFVILKNTNNKSLKGNFLIDPEIEKQEFFLGIAGVGKASKREKIFKILFDGLEKFAQVKRMFSLTV